MSAWLRVCVIACVSSASPALASDPAAMATAEALFRDGVVLMQRQHYVEACPKLAESQRLDPAFGTQFHLAECYEKLGKIASAWGQYTDVALQTRRAGQTKRAAIAEARAAALAPRISHVRIDVAQPVEGIAVRRGEVSLPRPQWGSALPTDPGVYVIEASAPGHESYRSDLTVGTEGETLTVKIPALEPEQRAGPPPSSPPPSSPPPSSPPPSSPPPSSPPQASVDGWSDQAVAGSIMSGLGVAGVAVGLGLGVKAKLDHNAVVGSSHCVDGVLCDEEGQGRVTDAQRWGTAATVIFVAGGTLATAGLVVWLTAPTQGQAEVSVQLAPDGSLRVSGRW